MRVMQICSARSIGGGERHVADLSNELTRRGHEVFAAVVANSPMAGEMSEVPRQNIAVFSMTNALDVASAVKIGRFARENKIELINAHLAKDYPLAAAAARMARIPYVITRHVLFPMNRLHRTFLRNVKFVICPSNAVAKSLRKQGIFPADKITTIRYGLDVSRFTHESGDDRNGQLVGTIGNIDPVKGFDIFVRAAAIVVEELPDVRFEIAGEDRSRDNRNLNNLRRQIAALGLEDRIRLSGWSGDVNRTLEKFDLFVSASRSESFGFVIAEAMLAGVPVIASATEGAKEIIADESLGRLVPIGSPELLARAILHLLKDEPKRRFLATSGRQYVRDNFSVERMVDETEALYRRAIKTT